MLCYTTRQFKDAKDLPLCSELDSPHVFEVFRRRAQTQGPTKGGDMSSQDLHYWADLTAILTFVVGVYGYLKYRYGLHEKFKKLEEYLRSEKLKGENKGQRSPLRIVSDVGLTEDEAIQASFRNPRIGRRVVPNARGLADDILFEYLRDK